ncbi:MAG: hypothetical protein V3S01_01030 [Dehalococcoidia bacterium]
MKRLALILLLAAGCADSSDEALVWEYAECRTELAMADALLERAMAGLAECVPGWLECERAVVDNYNEMMEVSVNAIKDCHIGYRFPEES